VIFVGLSFGLQYGALLHVDGISVHMNVEGLGVQPQKQGARGVNLWSETV
jgi:hypothetical protein